MEKENKDTLVVESEPVVENVKQEIEEHQKKLEQQIDPKTQKIIYVSEISTELTLNLKESVYSLIVLKEDVDFRRKFILDKVEDVKNKAENLTKTYKVKFDKKEQEETEKSVKEYAALLEGICKELNQEIFHNYTLLNEGENKIKKLVAPINSPDLFEEYVIARIKWTKKFVKDLSKNLSVSYSRYNFSFDDRERRLTILESNLKHYASNK